MVPDPPLLPLELLDEPAAAPPLELLLLLLDPQAATASAETSAVATTAIRLGFKIISFTWCAPSLGATIGPGVIQL